MFSQTSVILSTGGVHGRGCDDRGSMHGRGGVAGACVVEGACMAGMCMAGGMHGRGMCGRGVHGRGCVWQKGMHGLGAYVAGEMTTAADGMHRTGIHSCLMKFAHYSKGWSS